MISYYKMKNSPDVYEVDETGQAKPVSAAELAQRGVPASRAVEVDPAGSGGPPAVARTSPAVVTAQSDGSTGGTAQGASAATSFAGRDTDPSTRTRAGLRDDPTEGTTTPGNGATGNDGRGGGGGGNTDGNDTGGSNGGAQDHDDATEDQTDEHTGQTGAGSGTGGTTTINIGARDTRPSITLNPTIGDAAPVQERTAQGLNLHRDAPTAFTPSGEVIDPGQATQAGAYQAPGARSAPQAFQHARIEIPPPPAPPQVGDATGMLGDVESFARDAMANPNRYSSDWMKAAEASINGQITNSRAEGLRSIAEQMASRGLVGSGMEMTQDASLEGQLDQNRLNQLADLMQQMAAVDAQDRATAGQLGVQAGQLGIDAARFRNDAEYRNAVLTEQGAMDRANLQLNQQDIDLRAHQIQQEAIQRGQQMDLDQARDQATNEIQRGQLAEQGREFNVSSNIDQQQFNQDIALRAHQIQQDAIQRGQAMDLEEAMDQARRQVDLDRIAVEERGAISDERLKELALLLQAMQAVNA
jgi:hypothetical protein